MKRMHVLAVLTAAVLLCGQFSCALAAVDTTTAPKMTFQAPEDPVTAGSTISIVVTPTLPGFLTLRLTDTFGSEVALLYSNRELHTKANDVSFALNDSTGRPVPAGIYQVTGTMVSQYGVSSDVVAAPLTVIASLNPNDPDEELLDELGMTGAYNLAGMTGTTGAYNPTAAAGATGAYNPAAATGTTGTYNPTAATGTTGTYNPAAATGTTGTYNPAAAAGTTGTYNPAAATGTTGTYNPAGVTGSTGTYNPAGVSGSTGTYNPAAAGTYNPAGATGTYDPTGTYNPAGAAGTYNPAGTSSGSSGLSSLAATPYGSTSAYGYDPYASAYGYDPYSSAYGYDPSAVAGMTAAPTDMVTYYSGTGSIGAEGLMIGVGVSDVAQQPNAGYWGLTSASSDAEIWAALTKDMVAVDVDEKESAYIYDSVGEGQRRIGTVSGLSQGLNLVFERSDGWSLVEAYRNEDGAFVRGYIRSNKLRTVEVNKAYGIVVDKATQTLTVYQNGQRVGSCMVTTGLPTTKYLQRETPAGEFITVTRRGTTEYAGKGYSRYTIRINGNYHICELPTTRKNGSDYSILENSLGTKASRGNITVQHMASADGGINAKWIWDMTDKNKKVKVLIFDDKQRSQVPAGN